MYKIILKNITNKILYNPYLFRARLTAKLKQLSTNISIHSTYHHKIHFECSAAFLFLGYANQFIAKYDTAAENFKQSIFQDPYNQDAAAALKAPYKSPNPTNMGASYLNKLFYDNKTFSVPHPQGKKYVYNLAITSFLEQDYKNSLELLSKIFYTEKHNEYVYLLTGIIYLYKHNYQLAHKYLVYTISLLNKKHSQYHMASSNKFYQRAQLYYALKELDLACDDLTKAIDLNHENSEALVLRAKIYIRKKELINALKDLERVKRLGYLAAQKTIDRIYIKALR